MQIFILFHQVYIVKENIDDKLINKIDDFNDSTLKFTLNICNNSLDKINEQLSEGIFDIKLFSDYLNYEPEEPMNSFHIVFDNVPIDQSNKVLQSQFFKIKDNYLETVYSNELLNFMMKNNILRCNFLNSKKNNCNFLELSSGEKLFLNVLTNFSYTLYNLHNDFKSVMLFDDIELSFHPNWQKKLLKSFIYIYDEIIKNKTLYIHLIFTSHSPFILSDLPKQNVIFLEKDEKTGNCINATKNININPFGANIHTLLSHGFFMKDGLMGEFAKDKIDIAIKYLNKTKLSDNEITYCENIISIIGEPIIKRQLQRKLDSKKLSKLDKIDEIEEQMKLLAHRLEMIRKNQK